MTIIRLNKLIDDYQASRAHTRWVERNLEKLPAVKTRVEAEAVWTTAMDQQNAALREVIKGAQELHWRE